MKQIELTQGKVALVDDKDFKWLNQWNWCASKMGTGWYAQRGIRTKNKHDTSLRMHRVILNAQKGQMVDHKDCNGLNNQRHNLRLCTPSQNAFNRRNHCQSSSKYKGVSWNKKCKKWRAYIKLNHKIMHLGSHIIEEEAALAYDKKAKELFGEFARPNFERIMV